MRKASSLERDPAFALRVDQDIRGLARVGQTVVYRPESTLVKVQVVSNVSSKRIEWVLLQNLFRLRQTCQDGPTLMSMREYLERAVSTMEISAVNPRRRSDGGPLQLVR